MWTIYFFFHSWNETHITVCIIACDVENGTLLANWWVLSLAYREMVQNFSTTSCFQEMSLSPQKWYQFFYTMVSHVMDLMRNVSRKLFFWRVWIVNLFKGCMKELNPSLEDCENVNILWASLIVEECIRLGLTVSFIIYFVNVFILTS